MSQGTSHCVCSSACLSNSTCQFFAHLEQAFEIVLEEMQLGTDVLEETWALVQGLEQILPLLRTNYE